MENRFKMRISRMFRSSLASCRPKDITANVIERSPIFLPGSSSSSTTTTTHRHHQLIELLSPKPPPPPLPPHLSGRGKQLKWSQTGRNKKPLFSLTETEGQKCPPVSPSSPFLNTFYDHHHHQDRSASSSSSSKNKEKTKKTKKPKRVRSKIKSFGLHDEFPACNYNGLFSSDDGDDDVDVDSDDITTLFSSRSLSSDSSESLSRSRSCRIVQRTNSDNFHHRYGRQQKSRTTGVKDDLEIMGPRSTSMLAGLKMEGKVKDSFAVVKRSSDPYNDFRTSMVEMILERQLFSADELEKLLQCFLSLNAYQHHRVIVQVFTEIWEALFSNR
ncbi:OLC1v1037296C1 [Oldenlandia corymbosa var. corymbosa]|uniref:Transcription repressor n=1 Tax=Oldenlandia corymbosa var. corymbosa TaxID=529605 RepID=A0AAV1CYQ7_OLDCO|nr:OLC1v1037296C1 [Oldenlandia corymbosa var. corymbosa]